jgi:phospholipase A1
MNEYVNKNLIRNTILLLGLNMSVGQGLAQEQQSPIQAEPLPQLAQEVPPPPSFIDRRTRSERIALANPFSISQHRFNYVLPYSHIDNPNQIGNTNETSGNIDNSEAKYQISVKMPIYLQDDQKEGLFFGFTAVSFWQIYNSDISKPFRETNYEPEVFYDWSSDYHVLGYRFNALRLGVNHQSNGQSQLRSRSWNRIFTSLLFSDEDSFYFVKAWYRLKEDAKADPLDPIGDDNPDITHYLGHFELGYGTRMGKFKLFSQIRNNLKTSENRGSIEINLTYPINTRYELLLHYFNGYGDSLIDYNRHQQRIGLGVQLSFL